MLSCKSLSRIVFSGFALKLQAVVRDAHLAEALAPTGYPQRYPQARTMPAAELAPTALRARGIGHNPADCW
jgi:hypothetical protein